jgi:hypothetical protein
VACSTIWISRRTSGAGCKLAGLFLGAGRRAARRPHCPLTPSHLSAAAAFILGPSDRPRYRTQGEGDPLSGKAMSAAGSCNERFTRRARAFRRRDVIVHRSGGGG